MADSSNIPWISITSNHFWDRIIEARELPFPLKHKNDVLVIIKIPDIVALNMLKRKSEEELILLIGTAEIYDSQQLTFR